MHNDYWIWKQRRVVVGSRYYGDPDHNTGDAGAGALFSGLLTYDYANDSNPLKVYAKITLTDAKETVFEVCHLTAVNNDMLTVVRGQEGTAAKGWSLNDVIANFATRGSENQFVQIEQLQSAITRRRWPVVRLTG